MFTRSQRMNILKWGVLILISASIVPILAHADLPYRLSNANFFTTPHEQPVSFTSDGLGGFIGYTESGRLFRQYPVVTDSAIRLHRFEIDDAYFYISDRGIIVADNNLLALSIYYSRATNTQIGTLALQG